MSEFYKEILQLEQNLSYDPSVPSTTLSQYLWFNKQIKIVKNSLNFSHFSNHGFNFIGNLPDINGKYKSWDAIKYEYNSTDKEKFRWLQLVHLMPKLWVEALNKDLGLSVILANYDQNLIKNCPWYTRDKLVSQELNLNLKWKEIYILPRKVSIDRNLRMFQYKILNNILFLNDLLFKFKKVQSPLCFF